MKQKYWALYYHAGFDIITDKEYQEELERSFECRKYPDYISDFLPFESFSAAKKYIKMHLDGDLNDAKVNLYNLRKIKKENLK